MAMRIDIDFAKPLDTAQRTSLLLALAGLAGSERAWVVEGGHAAIVMGEAMCLARVRAALVEMGLKPESLTTSLSAEEDANLDESRPPTGAVPGRSLPPGR